LTVAFPFLRLIKKRLEDATMFDEEMEASRHEEFHKRLLIRVNGVRRAMARLLNDRFRGVEDDMLWISILDSWVSAMRNFSVEQRAAAERDLLAAALVVAQEQARADTRPQATNEQRGVRTTPLKPREQYMSMIYNDGKDMSEQAERTTSPSTRELQQRCKAELDACMIESDGYDRNADPLDWWSLHGKKFPILSVLARRWLSCVATSAPSERAFSTGGNIVTAKRCSLSPTNVRDAVFVADNLYLERRMQKEREKKAMQQQKRARMFEPPEVQDLM
jgi:hypothetical protein